MKSAGPVPQAFGKAMSGVTSQVNPGGPIKAPPGGGLMGGFRPPVQPSGGGGFLPQMRARIQALRGGAPQAPNRQMMQQRPTRFR